MCCPIRSFGSKSPAVRVRHTAMFALGLTLALSGCRSGRLDGKVERFIAQAEQQTGKRVVVIEYPGNLLSNGNTSSTTIYAFLRPHAPDQEIAAAVLHGVLHSRGYATVGSIH